MEQLRVQWTEFPTSLTGALGQLQHAGELSDVTLACEGRHIHAHKLVLSACSPYFRDAFKENPCHHPIIILKDVLARDILYLLSYMYQGEVNVEEDKLPSFIQTAELLQIKGLSPGTLTQTNKNKSQQNQKKNISQINTIPKNINQYNNPSNLIIKDNLPATNTKTQQQKRRRNSTSDKLSESDNSKKIKINKDKTQTTPSKKNESNDNSKTELTEQETYNESTNNNENASSSTNVSDEKQAFIEIEIKHEIEDLPDMDDEEFNDKSNDDTGTAPSSPISNYENSMLARSLLSGTQSIKNDSSSNMMNKSVQIASNASTIRKPPNTPTSSSSIKFSGPSDETNIKTEQLSPQSDVMEFEPEVLISEQNESLSSNRSGKNSSQTILRSDQAGTSQASFNQANHAAICGDCPHCGTKYSNQSALKYHVRLMHSDLTNRLCCYLCPCSFTMRDTFKEHMWNTHGQRN